MDIRRGCFQVDGFCQTMSNSRHKFDAWAFSAFGQNVFGHTETLVSSVGLRHEFLLCVRFEEWRYLGVLEHLAGLHGSTGSVSWIGMESEAVICRVQYCSGVGGVNADDVERYVLGSIPEEASVVSLHKSDLAVPAVSLLYYAVPCCVIRSIEYHEIS